MTIFSEGLLSRLVNNNLINQDGAVYIAVFIGFVVLSITVSYLLGSISEESRKLKMLVTEFCDRFNSRAEVLAREVAHAVHL